MSYHICSLFQGLALMLGGRIMRGRTFIGFNGLRRDGRKIEEDDLTPAIVQSERLLSSNVEA